MKKTLLLFTTLVTLIGYSQSSINNFFSIPMSSYAIVEASPAIDQSASGAGLTWNFTNFTATGTNTDLYAAPTASELTAYPGTTNVLTIDTSGSTDENKILAKESSGDFSFTGVSASDIELNYNTDNALLGTFPLSYLDSNSDAVAGTFTGQGITGTFTGTITTTVDAYGTLNMNDVGEGAYTGNVTRIKVVQDLSLTYIFPDVGDVLQTSYYYYDDSTGNLVFRSNTADITIPLANIDETITLMESFLEITLSTEANTLLANTIQVVPNPVSDVLHIKSEATNSIESVTITDLNGRTILNTKAVNSGIPVSTLQSGMYLVVIQTKHGLASKKFIKL